MGQESKDVELLRGYSKMKLPGSIEACLCRKSCFILDLNKD
jgi:hypothetical protein